MLYTEGLTHLLQGDPDRADPIFAGAVDLATAQGALPLAALVLAERSAVALERGDWPRVLHLVGQAVSIVRQGRFDDYWTSALVYAWATRAALHQGNIAQARHYLGRAARLRPLLSYALPVVSLQALIQMARAYISLADQGGAATVLQQADDILQQRPDLGVLPAKVSELRSQLARIGNGTVGASALTAAELRLLPLLPTHLSFQEIGERLHVSTNTVKSQAYSAYRKLGVSSRSAAVTRARELGLDVL
jgi:LuxR family maltose regulon positive regulatory protein